METELFRLVGVDHESALAARSRICDIALTVRNAARGAAEGDPARGIGSPFRTVEAYLADLRRRTVCMTLLAGSGSRWLKSLEAARAKGEGPDFDSARPRGLYPVRDFLRPSSFVPTGLPRDPEPAGGAHGAASGSGLIPIAAYALAAVRGLGRQLLVVRGWEESIQAEILTPLGIREADRDFFTQAAPYGKPLGHGDAAWQCRSLWSSAAYVIANFGGDANSRQTISASLLVLDALRAAGEDVDLVIPAARIPSPAYPIRLDANGLPRGFGHAKLQGAAAQRDTSAAGEAGAAAASNYTNVGVRVYRASALLARVQDFRARYWIEGEGYAIPGNDPAGYEFALDNVDSALAAEGKARILAIAQPEELTPVKSVEDIAAFERAVGTVTNLKDGSIRP